MFNKKNSQAVGWISMADIFILFTVLLFVSVLTLNNRVQDELDTSDSISQACCIGDKCSDVTQKICSELGGASYSGECSSIDCRNYLPAPQLIGCCFDGTTCRDMNSEECIANNGEILTGQCGTLDARHCSRVDEPEYSCCINGKCIELSEAACDLVNGTVYKYQDCTNVNCPVTPVPPDRFACCVGGDCVEVTKQECSEIAGEYRSGKKCKDVRCPKPPWQPSAHACCINGDCIELEYSECVKVNGTLYSGKKCDQVSCPKVVIQAERYACCINGDCIELEYSECVKVNGTAYSGSKCNQVECELPDSDDELPVELFNLAPPLNNVVFLVDKSSGMGQFLVGGGSKWQYVKNTIELWLEYLPIQEAGIVMFNTKDPPNIWPLYDPEAKAFRLQVFSNISQSLRRNRIAEFMNKLGNSTGGATNISLGFEWALKYTTSKGKRPDAIIFFSDGLPTTSSSKETIKKLKEMVDIPIHIVGTGNYFDQKSLDFFSEILSMNEKNSWRGTDGVLKEAKEADGWW